MKNKPVYGNHIGIVVNQEDPEYRGRVQVYIPYLTNTLYAGWNEDLKDKKFKNLGADGGGDLTQEVVEKLRNVLPWAECAAPIFGGGTSATYNQSTGRTSTNAYETMGPTAPIGPGKPLTNPTKLGLIEKAKSILSSNRKLNFGNYIGNQKFQKLDGTIIPADEAGRCLTAVSALVGVGINKPKLGSLGTESAGPKVARAIASGENVYFQKNAGYGNPEPVGPGYVLQRGEILAMEGGPTGQGHIIVGIGNGESLSDHVSEKYQEYLPGGGKNGKEEGQYNNVVVLRPGPEAAAAWATTMGESSDGSSLGVPSAPNAATAAEIAATAVNPDDKATGSDSTVKDVAVSEGEQQRQSSLNASAGNAVDSQQLYNTIHDHLKTKLGNNPVPQDITQYGVEANLEGLTTLMMKVAYKESAFIPTVKGDTGKFSGYNASTGQQSIPGGSHGLFQMSPIDAATYKHLGFKGNSGETVAWKKGGSLYNTGAEAFTTEQLEDPNFNVDLATSIWADSINKSGLVGNDTLKNYGWIKDSEVAAGKLNKYDQAGFGKLAYSGPGGTIGTVSSANSLTSPYPNFNAGNVAASCNGPQASGMISIPKPGAKVFVFFLAGDIQKPVYFANALEPETVRKSLQSASLYGKTYQDANVNKEYGGLHAGEASLGVTNELGFVGGTIPYASSNVKVSADGSELVVSPGASRLNNAGDFTSITMGGSYETVNGPKSSHTGPSFKQIDGDHTIKVGVFDEKQTKAAENLHKLLKEVQKEKVESIEKEAPNGEKVPCPVCSVTYPVDKATATAKRIFKFLRNLGSMPWWTYSIDVLTFIGSLVMIPFFTIAKAASINGGSCGNPDCENGQLPSPQKPIENANKAASEKLKSKQEEILKLEQQLGNGGTHSVVAAKDIVLSAGLIVDDQSVYSKIGHTSHPCRVEPAKDAKGTVIRSGTGVPQVMHCEATQLPGGNIMLRGGSKVQIIAGAPGIELSTKGKITIGAGSVEIISSDSDLMLASPTHTIVKGNGVTIDADDKSGKGGGLVINAKQTSAKGFGVSGNMILAGGLNMKGELSCTYTNTVGERVQSGSGSPPDQRVPFGTWAVGPLQTNDTLNTIRTALTHFAMPGALLMITNIVKLFQQVYNRLFTSTIIEPITTGFGVGIGYVQIWNWHHNHMNEPEDHHHDYTRPRGTYYDDDSGVHQSACEASDVPTRARKKGSGPDGGPKTLAGCGGFGFGGGGGSSGRSVNLNSFGIADLTPGFTNTRLGDKNNKFEYNDDGTIKVILPEKQKC